MDNQYNSHKNLSADEYKALAILRYKRQACLLAMPEYTPVYAIAMREAIAVVTRAPFLLLMALVALMCLSGCSKRYDDLPAYSPISFGNEENKSVGRFKTTYLVDQIDEYYRGTNPGPLGVTTFVNVDDLYATSTFGRMVGEQVMSELVMRGFDVVEMRHSDAVQFLAPNGEFALSRDVSTLRGSRDLGGIVVGTYVVSPVRVYVNARLIDPASSMVLSAGSVEMSKTPELVRLLRGGSIPSTMERIPVRHLAQASYPLQMFPGYQPGWVREDGFDYQPAYEQQGHNAAVATPPVVPQMPALKQPKK